jgi:hypothetical protein
MAKGSDFNIPVNQPRKIKGKLPVSDRTTYYTDLHYIPSADKNAVWMSQTIWFAKKNAVRFIDVEEARKKRMQDKLELDERVYRQMVDPPTPMDDKGGQAKYFAADFKANPIYIHLKNIIKAGIQKIPKNLMVSLKDEYAMLERQRDNYKTLMQREFRHFLNKYNEELGLPKIKDSQDPYKWAQNFINDKGGGGNGKTPVIDTPVNIVDFIRNQIQDEQDMALYNEYVYRGDIEMAFELGIAHYLLDQNKYDIVSEDFLDDIMHFNKACGTWYTDQITGRPQIEYIDGTQLWVSPFKSKYGDDLMYYFIEYDITFADFVRQFGHGLSHQDLVNVFELNKRFNPTLNATIDLTRPTRQIDQSKIRIGKIAVLTQDYDTFSEAYVRGNYSFQVRPYDWKPSEWSQKNVGASKKEKHYNVWYTAYYIPPDLFERAQADYNWQSQFVFQIEKVQDMQRYGADRRYVRPPLVIWNNFKQASFSDVTDAFMPKIHHAWHKFQNSFIQATNGVAMSQELLGSMLNAVDEANKDGKGNGKDAGLEMWKMLKQSGKGFLKFTDKNGNAIVDPSKLFVPINDGLLEAAERYLNLIIILYDQMTRALAINDVVEGQDVKPRTSLGAVDQSIQQSNKAVYFVQHAFEKFTLQYAERVIQYISDISKEPEKYGYTKRWEDFIKVIGMANGLMIEGIKDIPLENIGLTVKNEEGAEKKKEYWVNLATNLANQGALDFEILNLLIKEDNYKLGAILVIMGFKKKQREVQEQKEREFEQAMALEDKRLQTAQALMGVKTQGKVAEIQSQGQVDAQLQEIITMLKTDSMMTQKDQLLKNKMMENEQKSELKKDEKVAEKFTPVTS